MLNKVHNATSPDGALQSKPTMIDTTREYYNNHAQEYFQATWTVSLKHQWHTLTRRLRPGASILDLGCGSGRDLRLFASEGFIAIGVDYSYPLLNLSQQRAGQPVVLGDLVSLPFADQSFDATWAIGSLLHVEPVQLPKALKEIRRVLKPDGFLFSSMKRGHGTCLDQFGRRSFLYEPEEWGDAVKQAGFCVAELREAVETRHSATSTTECIPWIEALIQVV